ncbi:exportin 1 [Heterostelium album PN500]|uniref:Exportin-1 n=1 Tax=Heterostelium pallidum (strain ATCC 26659 / Pp 5 / PN500) TaxID=670386 RepID=D3BG39_HETP5|nr:exportin 1 [Heterostelium album PN500]EFA79631.1 exportin 1 [Heterostelium album PN500]|eukprot:XP_020431752.1 exportin 1 [Heterostelium album PN500]
MENILNFNETLDINLLDNIVNAVYHSTNAKEREQAQKVLGQFQEHPDSWMRVDSILTLSNNPQTRFFALLILESLIKYKWKALPREQCDGIKNFIVRLIITLSSDPQSFAREKQLLNKLDIIFVQILKKEWPHHWSSFVPEIVNSSRTNEYLCENNMNILKILSEEIFNFSEEQMTQAKIQDLKISFEKEFSLINELCQFILENATRPSLVKATLDTLQRFLFWIPLHYIIETHPTPEPSKLVKLLLSKYFPEMQLRNSALKCLIEIAGLSLGTEYDGVFVHIIDQFMNKLKFFKPDPSTIPKDFEEGESNETDFIHSVAIFLTTFFKVHLKIVESPMNIPYLTMGHEILIHCSNVDDIEIFKICLEYWNFLSSNLYTETPFLNGPPRLNLYKPILSKVRVVLISRMAKPEEVIVVEDENGMIVREQTKDTDSLTLYESMRETLIFLTNLDPDNTQNIMLDKLNVLVTNREWSYQKINTLCWAIGSISGAQNKDQEKKFLVTVIKELLELCQVKRGKDNKAVIASDIMYIVGQYPRFLKDHWKFLKTVVNKLFEFMHESHPGVQDMACDTFLKIAKQCKRKFVILQVEESQPFINELLNNLPTYISDLEPGQVHTFYESVGYMISSSTDPATRDRLVIKLMELPNNSWTQIMGKAATNVESILNVDMARNIVNLLKTNNRAALSLGPYFLVQMSKIYLDLLNVYRTYSDFISKNPQQRTTLIMSMKSVKKETLKLLETFVEKTTDKSMLYKNFIPPMLEAVLGDYKTNVPEARDPEVLSLMAVVVTSVKQFILPEVTKILEAVFECTLGMITKNFEDYPYHRINFFNLIRAINAHTFSVFHSLSPQQFKLLIDCVVWAFKHTERNISETGLNILKELIENVSKDSEVSNAFFKSYLVPLLTDIMYILTDSFHKSGFNLQCDILKMMLQVVENGMLKVCIWDQAANPQPAGMTNAIFVREILNQFLSTSPNVSKNQVQSMTQALFSLANVNSNDFKVSVRDFLITLKEFQGVDNVELFSEEKAAEREAILKKAQAIPDHKRVLELICHECNKLLCSRCSANHNKDVEHSNFVDHIDEIRLSLNQILNNNSNNNNDTPSTIYSNHITKRLDDIWKTVKSSTTKYSELDSKEKLISKHFEELHLYLMNEEKRIKTPIIDDKEIIINQIENNINELKYLINIIKLNDMDTSSNNSDTTKTSNTSSSDNIDITTSYSIPSIMESIDTNQTLSSFIKSNNETIFYCNPNNNNYNIQDILLNYDNNIDSMILDLIYKYNNQFKSSSSIITIIPNNNNNYNIKTKHINLVVNYQSKHTYMLSTHHEGVSLIDLSNYNITDLGTIKDYNPYGSQSFAIGGNIYMFGGYDNLNKYCIYSIKHQTYQVYQDESLFYYTCQPQACYDGQDHIYLIVSHQDVCRFNIRTSKFELFHSDLPIHDPGIITVYDKEYLYIIPRDEFEMTIFDIKNKTIEKWQSDQKCKWMSACTDGNGNIYLHSTDRRFVRLNIQTKEITNLKNSEIDSGVELPMLYHKESEEDSYIYIIGGDDGSGRYSIQKDQWESILSGDKLNRYWCSATIFKIDT